MGARLRRDAQSFISAFLVRNVRRRLLDPSPPLLELEFGGGGAGKGKVATFDGIYAMTSHGFPPRIVDKTFRNRSFGKPRR